MRRWHVVSAAVLAAGVAVWPVAHVRAQRSSPIQTSANPFPNPNSASGQPNSGRADDPDLAALNSRIDAQQMKSRNSERQRKIQSDTDKLLELATQLKEQLDKQDKTVTPADAAKKAEEIEKLARSVQQKMKG